MVSTTPVHRGLSDPHTSAPLERSPNTAYSASRASTSQSGAPSPVSALNSSSLTQLLLLIPETLPDPKPRGSSKGTASQDSTCSLGLHVLFWNPPPRTSLFLIPETPMDFSLCIDKAVIPLKGRAHPFPACPFRLIHSHSEPL